MRPRGMQRLTTGPLRGAVQDIGLGHRLATRLGTKRERLAATAGSEAAPPGRRAPAARRTTGRGRPAGPPAREPQGRAPRRHPPAPSRRRPGRHSTRPRRPRRCPRPGHAGPRRRCGRRGRARRPASPGPAAEAVPQSVVIPAASRQLAWPRSGTCSACSRSTRSPRRNVSPSSTRISPAVAARAGSGRAEPSRSRGTATESSRPNSPMPVTSGQRRPQAGDGARSEDAADAHAARRIVSDTDFASLGSRHCD